MSLEFMGCNVIRIFPYAFHNNENEKRGTNKKRSFLPFLM